MENVMTNGFAELSFNEMETIEGGGWAQVAGVFVGTVSVAWSPVVTFFCPPAGIGMALGGAGLIGKATGAY